MGSVFFDTLISDFLIIVVSAISQDLPDQEEAGKEDETEQTHPLLDPHENRQHHQVCTPLLFNFCFSISFSYDVA